MVSASKPFPAFLAGKRLLAGMGPNMPSQLCRPLAHSWALGTFVASHLKDKITSQIDVCYIGDSNFSVAVKHFSGASLLK